MSPRVVRWMLSAALLFGAACTGASEEDDPDATEGAFSVLPVDAKRSLLGSIEASKGKPNVCIALLGFDAAARKSAGDKIARLITESANAWNDLLKGDALWTLKDDVAPKYSFQETECPRSDPTGFGVNVWATADKFKAEYCAGRRSCASSAIGQYRSMYLGPWNRTVIDNIYDAFTVLHEYGHLLGMGDTYRVPGVNEWVGEQPPSIMNGLSRTLTDDDKLGIHAVLKALKTGARSCEGFGDAVQMTANGFEAFMCKPGAKAVDTHEQTPVEPRGGAWAYDGIDFAKGGISIRGVKPSVTGFSMLLGVVEQGKRVAERTYLCNTLAQCADSEAPTFTISVMDENTMRMINPNTPEGGSLVRFDHWDPALARNP